MLILEKFGIVHDFVYHQSQHLNIHQNLAIKLLKEKKAYITLDNNPKKELDFRELKTLKEKKEKFTIRVKDITILDNRGNPTPIFASACDNILSKVDFIIREESKKEWSRDEIYIQELFDYRDVNYFYIPDFKDNITIKELFKEGFIPPDAIINYLLLVGYRDTPKEVFYLKDAIEWFSLDNISKEDIEFDIEKLKYLNREHIKLMDDRELSRVFGFADVNNIGKLAKLYLEDSSTLNELNSKIMPIFKPKDFDNELGDDMRILSDIIFNAPAFERFEEFKKYLMEKSGLDEKRIEESLKLLLTNSKDSPNLSRIYPLIKSYILEVAS